MHHKLNSLVFVVKYIVHCIELSFEQSAPT